MSMKKKHRRALDRTLQVLSDDLDLQPAITYLRSKELFTEEHESRINAQQVQTKMVSEFVTILKRSGDEAYSTFRTHLLKCPGQRHIATELDKSLEEVEESCALEEADLRKTDDYHPWSFYNDQFYCFPCCDSMRDYTSLPRTLRFLLLGKTGSGKSATGNTILGNSVFEEGSRSESHTKTIRSEETKGENEFNIRVIDTPGLFDTAKDFSNNRLSLEIAKAVCSFKDGIHLFLLVCNSSMKFTPEEEDTIQHIEAVMKKDIYGFCVLILTHAKGKFGEDGKESLEQYIAEEKKANTKFSDLLNSVGNRIIAVENSFSEAVLRKNHRQRLLTSLAEVVKRNNGLVYRNQLFEKASIEIDKEYTRRQNRYEKRQNEFRMKFMVEKYVYHILPTLNEKQLHNLKHFLIENMQKICENSGANSIANIDGKKIENCLKQFVTRNKDLVEEYIGLKKLQITKTKNELERQRQISVHEDSIKMKNFVVNVVGNFLRQCEKRDLREIQKSCKLPDVLWGKIFKLLEGESIKIPEEDVREYVQETFFQTPDDLQKYIDERETDDLIKEIEIRIKEMSLVEEEKQRCKLAENLLDKIPDFIKALSQENETKLRDAMQKEDDHKIGFMVDMFLKDHAEEKEPERYESLKAIIKMYFIENRALILGLIKVLKDQRSKLDEVGMTAEQCQRKLDILKKVSDVIDEHLQSYLANKSVKQLKEIGKQLNNDKVPQDILNKVMKHLYETENQITDETMVADEILTQLQTKIKIMEVLAEESKSCFPALSFVQTKVGTRKLISNLTIGDEVLVFDSNGKLKYEKVYLISHANKEEITTYIGISTKQGRFLSISPNHLLPIGRLNNNVSAKQASVGETIFSVKNGALISDIIEKITYQKLKGAFCPMTMNGSIVVNGVAASCFTTLLDPSLAQTLLCPFKVMFNYLPTSVFNAIVPYDSAEGMPIILSLCRSLIIAVRSLGKNVNH